MGTVEEITLAVPRPGGCANACAAAAAARTGTGTRSGTGSSEGTCMRSLSACMCQVKCENGNNVRPISAGLKCGVI